MKFFNCRLLTPLLILSLFWPGPTRAAGERNTIHHLVIQVTQNDPGVMALALNNMVNVTQHYSEAGEEIEIELVAYGPGLHMLREDTSPVKEKIKSIRESMTNVTFTACGNTIASMEKAENKPVPILPNVKIVKAGVVRIMELQEQGWSYLRP